MKRIFLILTLFLGLSVLAFFIPHFQFDLAISHSIQNVNLSIFGQLMGYVSDIGNQPLMVLIVITGSLILFFKGQQRAAVICSLSTAIAALLGSMIKLLVDRPRPTADLVNVSVWLSDKSYPSNHVLVFTVFFGFLLYLLLKKTKLKFSDRLLLLVFSLLIASIGISRIYLGAHWVSDVLGGYLFGLAWLLITIKFYNSHHGKR